MEEYRARIALTPMELMEPDPNRIQSELGKVWGPLLCSSVALIGSLMGTALVKRPLMSGIQRHIISAIVGIGVGNVVADWKVKYLAEKDAISRHYMQLHPEDFPPFERIKYSDQLLHWVPVR